MHLYRQQFGGILEKKSFTSSFFGKNAKKKNVFEDKWFLSKCFLKSKCMRLQTGLATLKNIKQLCVFLNDRFFMQFSEIAFFRDF